MNSIKLSDLIGRTIVDAAHWDDMSSMSIVLDNGGILQIHANDDEIRFELEFAPELPT